MKPSRHVKPLGVRDPRGFSYAEVDLDVLIPDPENPRIPSQESALETILALVREDSDGLYNLARDIVKMRGTNPAELLNVREEGGWYLVKEGNRRIAARKLLRNPEQLRGHVADAEVERWVRLSKEEGAARLPTTALVVVGDDHEAWVDRRHLGPQAGVGVVAWGTEAKARRAAGRLGVKDRTVSLLDNLKASYPDRFKPLDPPKRTFTTFSRVLDSQRARAHIGLDTDEQGNVVLLKGEHSLRLIEEVLRDLRKQGKDKLTSRRIHSTDQIVDYLDGVDSRIGPLPDGKPVTLSSGSGKPGARPAPPAQHAPRPTDILKSLAIPIAARPRKILEELRKARKSESPNAAIILCRVLLELCVDDYADRHSLPFAGDKNPEVEQEVQEFQRQLSTVGVQPSKVIREALKFAASRPLNLGSKLEQVIRHLMQIKALNAKEGNAKIRELGAKDVVNLLNDAVHRLHVVPSLPRVDHILEVVGPVLNAMHDR